MLRTTPDIYAESFFHVLFNLRTPPFPCFVWISTNPSYQRINHLLRINEAQRLIQSKKCCKMESLNVKYYETDFNISAVFVRSKYFEILFTYFLIYSIITRYRFSFSTNSKINVMKMIHIFEYFYFLKVFI